jgi:hypothetical protein
MAKIHILALLTLALTISIPAQTSAVEFDFTGTWVLDEKKTFRDKTRRDEIDDYRLVIEDSGEIVRIVESYQFKDDKFRTELALRTDESGETNPYFKNDAKEKEIASETSRKKNYIERKYRETKTFGNTEYEYETTERFILSKKGDRITLAVRKRIVSSSKPIHDSEIFLKFLGDNTVQKYIFRKES